MTIQRWLRIMCIVYAVSIPLFGLTQTLKDPRRVLIAPEEIMQLIHANPLNVSKLERVQSRANASGLYKLSYLEYTKLWKQHPDSWIANLIRGEAAEDYWATVVSPLSGELRLGSPQETELRQAAQTCLSKAYSLAPDETVVQIVYGHYLWQYGEEKSKGLSLLKKALERQPNSARINFVLGNYYQSTADREYDPRKSEQFLVTATRLDPAFASAHFCLMRLYARLFRYQDAASELKTYRSLVPLQNAVGKGVEMYEKEIQAGLDN